MIEFQCPHCGINITAEAEHAGASADCPSCGGSLMVPKPVIESPASPQPPDLEKVTDPTPDPGLQSTSTPPVKRKQSLNLKRLTFIGTSVLAVLILITRCDKPTVNAERESKAKSPPEDPKNPKDPLTQFLLGWKYLKGEGVLQDYDEGVKWIRRSAEQGEMLAQLQLGYCYIGGQGVELDLNEGVKWWLKSADQGLNEAQFKMGMAYSMGMGTTKDYTVAYMWYNLAANSKDNLVKSEAKKAQLGIAGHMTREQISEAQRLSREWKPKKDNSVN